MRFRCKIVDVSCLNHFTRVVNTITKLTKSCTLRLTPDNLYFILTDKVANGGVSMWCELCQANFFDEYQMEGVSQEQNEIYLELVPENVSRALKTAQNAKAVKIKLTNKHCPCLTVAVELVLAPPPLWYVGGEATIHVTPCKPHQVDSCSPLSGVLLHVGTLDGLAAMWGGSDRGVHPNSVPSLSLNSRIVTHDIPVSVIPRRLWNDFKEPTVPDFDVSIYLPAIKTMKSVVERMKNLSNFIVIEANRNGEMNLKIETDLVSVSTHFKDLGNPPWGPGVWVPRGSLVPEGLVTEPTVRGEDWVCRFYHRKPCNGKVSDDVSQNSTPERDPDLMSEARFDIKKLLQFLAGQQVNPNKAICNIVHKRMVHFILLHDDATLQYFIPALA
ncbi:checkpoint protein HUS1 isoform X1 [Aquarana catesbeiana]|uniref:checkpoint protein HUS1 isoform X1 n=1 Tax=Aquarana catesbeiana TaxID=8400 RepID=UPI003CC936F5